MIIRQDTEKFIVPVSCKAKWVISSTIPIAFSVLPLVKALYGDKS